MKAPADRWDREEREALEPVTADLAALRARHAGDPPLALLRAAQADALPPDLQTRVSAHLAESAWSRALVDGACDVDHVLDAADADRLLARITRSAEPRRSWRLSNIGVWAPLAGAAATIAIVAAVWAPWRTTAPASVVPVAAPPPPQATIARAEPPRFELPLDKPDVKLSVAALTWRGPSGASSLVDELAPALDAYRQSDYTRAAQGLEGVGRRFPASIEAPFYRGISLLFLNDPAGAIVELKKAERMKDAAFAPDVTWYLAVAEQRSGDTAAARAHLDALCRGTSARTPAACDAITRLGRAR
jgi:hypothetical protein